MALTTYTTKIRKLIEDFSKTRIDTFTYSTSSIFTLVKSKNVSIISVLVNGTSTADLSGVDYTYSSTTNQVTVTGLSSGDDIQIKYTYNEYSTSELENYVHSALDYININNDLKTFEVASGDVISPTPTTKQTSLICIVASILIKPNISQYSLPNLTVRYPRTMSKDQIIEKIVQKFFASDGYFYLIEITTNE